MPFFQMQEMRVENLFYISSLFFFTWKRFPGGSKSVDAEFPTLWFELALVGGPPAIPKTFSKLYRLYRGLKITVARCAKPSNVTILDS